MGVRGKKEERGRSEKEGIKEGRRGETRRVR